MLVKWDWEFLTDFTSLAILSLSILECKQATSGLFLRKGNVYILVSYVRKQRVVEINEFVQTLASLEIHTELSKFLSCSTLLLPASTQTVQTGSGPPLINPNLILHHRETSLKETNGISAWHLIWLYPG